jgi:hypothetical protein
MNLNALLLVKVLPLEHQLKGSARTSRKLKELWTT